MKIGIFIDNFFTTQTYKDPGVIAASLVKLGHQVTIYCWHTDLTSFQTIKVKPIRPVDSNSPAFWQAEDSDYIILYSWLSLRFSPLIKAVRAADKKIILKLDSDGQLIYPLQPTYLRTFGRGNSLRQWLTHLARLVQWSLLAKLSSRQRLEQLADSSAVIIESPAALANLTYSINFWQRPELNHKLAFIPDPVNYDALSTSNDQTRLSHKENIIVCNGRWDDKQKNRPALLKVLSQLDLTDWRLLILGTNSTQLQQYLRRRQPRLTITAHDHLPHAEMKNYLQISKIFFAPSWHESFNLSAAEALCSGCSLAGTPLESFTYFSADGHYGTLASDFGVISLKAALQTEMAKWQNQYYDPQATAMYWSQQLSPHTIGLAIANLLKNL
jgi:hypothetical protein